MNSFTRRQRILHIASLALVSVYITAVTTPARAEAVQDRAAPAAVKVEGASRH